MGLQVLLLKEESAYIKYKRMNVYSYCTWRRLVWPVQKFIHSRLLASAPAEKTKFAQHLHPHFSMDGPAKVSGQWTVYLVLYPFPLLSWTLPKTVFYFLWPWSKEIIGLLTGRRLWTWQATVSRKEPCHLALITDLASAVYISSSMRNFFDLLQTTNFIKICEMNPN